MKWPRVLLSGLLLIIAVPAAAAEFPRPTGHVNDFAAALFVEARSQLENLAVSLEERTGVQLAIVTMNLANESIEDTAPRLFKAWGIGKQGKDNGILILLAPDIRGVRIETGYGIEAILPDAAAGRIIRDVMIPRFRAGDLGGGLEAGSLEVIARVAKGLGVELEGVPPASVDEEPIQTRTGGPAALVIRFLFLLFIIYLFIKHPRLLFLMMIMSGGGGGGGRRGGFGGGGGGFGGFGGGLSGGGGAGGSW